MVKIEDLTTFVDEQKTTWYNLKIENIEGWIKEDNTNINPSKISAFDWPGFRIAKEEGDTAYDAVIDLKNLSPFFKRIVDEINTDSDESSISEEELRKALKDDEISFKLSRLICFHQSEWWTDSEMKNWDCVFKMVGTKRADNLKSRIKSLCWWDEVSMKVKDFLPTPNVYHWHPVAFVENMIEISDATLVLTKNNIATIIPKATTANINKYLQKMNNLFNLWGIDSRLKQAHVLSQIGHESGALRYTTEGGKKEYFQYMDKDSENPGAKRVARILGNVESGDGYRFRGRGLIQLTGRDNHTRYAEWRIKNRGDIGEYANKKLTNAYLEKMAQRIADEVELSIESALWFIFIGRTAKIDGIFYKLNEAMEKKATVKCVTKIVNGGYNGLDDRKEYFKRAFKELNVGGKADEYLSGENFVQ